MITMKDLIEKSKNTSPFFVINNIAKKNGYKMYVFDKNSNFGCFKKDNIRIAISFTKLKVMTTIDHPKRGRKQLTRAIMTLKEIKNIFENPRLHTGKGYYSKKDLIKYGGKEQKSEDNTV